MAGTTAHVQSIQGEQFGDRLPTKASTDDVDRYVDTATPETLACRERGRHLFPTISQVGITFDDVDSDGLLVRRLICTCCRQAIRVEKWDSVGRGKNLRYQLVAAHTQYQQDDEGRTYTAPPGRGRMTPRQIADSAASKALHGTTPAELRRAATNAGTTKAGRHPQ